MTITLLPSIDLLRELFSYDAQSGILRAAKDSGTRRDGSVVGSVDGNGRLRCEIDGRSYSVSHIAFAIYYGKWPAKQLDHKNNIKTDNSIENLREASNAQNSRNRPGHSSTGRKGVSYHKGQNKFNARIMVNGARKHLGSFDNADDAAAAYAIAAMELHGEFANLRSKNGIA